MTDQELLAALRSRAGDSDSGAPQSDPTAEAVWGELYRRHVEAARAAALAIAPTLDPDDLVAEAFARVLRAVQRGSGPDDAFRAYLSRTLYTVAVDTARAAPRTTADADRIPDPRTGEDPVAAEFERSMIARAFAALPARFAEVLWYAEVEQRKPRDYAPLLEVSANHASQLHRRAKERLRTEWLRAHLDLPGAAGECRDTLELIARSGARGRTAQTRDRIDRHTSTCRACATARREYRELAERLGRSVALVALISLPALAVAAARTRLGVEAAGIAPSAAAVPAASAGAGAAGASAGSAAAFGGILTAGLAACVGSLAIAGTLLLPSVDPLPGRTLGSGSAQSAPDPHGPAAHPDDPARDPQPHPASEPPRSGAADTTVSSTRAPRHGSTIDASLPPGSARGAGTGSGAGAGIGAPGGPGGVSPRRPERPNPLGITEPSVPIDPDDGDPGPPIGPGCPDPGDSVEPGDPGPGAGTDPGDLPDPGDPGGPDGTVDPDESVGPGSPDSEDPDPPGRPDNWCWPWPHRWC